MMSDLILLTAIFLFIFLIFYFLPTLNGKGTLFGLVVNETDAASGVLRKFRSGLLIIALMFGLAIALGFYFLPKSLPFAYIFSVLAMGWWLHTNLVRSWNLRKIETFSKFVTVLKPRRLLDYTNLWWELAIVLAVLIPFGTLIYFYPQLPETIPVHWNAGGEADRWEAKSVFNVFFISLLGMYLQIFLVITKEDIVKARFRVPAENAEQIIALKEISHRANLGLMDWCRLMVAILLGAINFLLLSVLTDKIVATAINLILWTDVALLLCGVGYYFYQIILVNRQIKEITGQVVFQTATEEKGWDNGLFYRNPDDVAFFVEKPGGVGYTLNFANKRTYLYLGMIGLLIAVSVIAPILF